jgi:glutamine amidotransferase
MIAIVDYGIGNIHSLISALGEENVVLTAEAEVLQTADLVILPGVGAFAYAMAALEEKGLIPILNALYRSGKWMVGICLGMQLFYESSDEHGFSRGLGFLKGHVTQLPQAVRLPHMGWNILEVDNSSTPLLKGIGNDAYAYFVHSYYASEVQPETVLASTTYGTKIPAVVQSGKVVGFQFHPEKSGQFGRLLIENLKEMIA